MVDFKLSVQEYQHAFPDRENTVPKFMTLAGFWSLTQGDGKETIPRSELMVPELYGHREDDCDGLWCHKFDCITDVYDFAMSFEPGRVDSNVKEMLEVYEEGKPHQADNLQVFRNYMEEKNLIRLLPGVVPGFVLRNRKWGEFNLRYWQAI